MKNTKSTIPLKIREDMSKDPFYKTCALYGQVIGGIKHECDGKVTWEHTLTYAGKKIQEPWSIIPLCEKYHGVNWHMDSGFLVKEINVWVALNRATPDDLRCFSKAINYTYELNRLNALYGVYKKIEPPVLSPLSQEDIKNRPDSLLEIIRVEIPPPLSTDILKVIRELKDKGTPIFLDPADFIIKSLVESVKAIQIIISITNPNSWPNVTENKGTEITDKQSEPQDTPKKPEESN